MDAPQQYCLRWKYHHSNLQSMFSMLLERGCFCDVVLACEGRTLKAHKVMLSACSTYFDSIFSQYEDSSPIVILKDVRFSDLNALVQFMYKGEINVDNSELTSLLKTAEELKIKGLAEVSWRQNHEMEDSCDDEEEEDGGEGTVEPPPAKKIKSDSIVSNFTAKTEIKEELNDSRDVCAENEEDEMDNYSEEDTKFHISGEKMYLDSQFEEEEKFSDSSLHISNSGYSKGGGQSSFGGSPEDLQVTGVATSEGTPNALDLSQFTDIMKMNDYLESGGRRPQFWEEPFTKRLMEAIKNKEVEMKVAAELMGVSYGTLYGRYRDAYGCLKHPYRVRDFWSEQGPAEVLAKLQRKELTLFRAAELLNVTVTTLANYLSTLKQQPNSSSENEATDVEETEEEPFKSGSGNNQDDEHSKENISQFEAVDKNNKIMG